AWTTILAGAQSVPSRTSPVSVSVYDRTRVDAWQWFAAPPQSGTYGYVESLLRLGIAQRTHHWDWQLELAQPSILGAPSDAVSTNATQGQLGLGATYYASNGNNSNPAAAFLKQGFLRYHFAGNDRNLRVGRFEFIEGQETQPENTSIAWLQANRIAHRLIGNFGFSNAQRSFDGIDSHFGKGSWDATAMAGRADQGVYNMNGNPELNVDLQYLAFSKSEWRHRFLWRAFAIGYHDGRTGIVKTDNRPLAIRQGDKQNIRIGTYGGDFLATVPAGSGQFDLLGWGVLQNGRWGGLDQRSSAGTVEGGYQFLHIASTPWLRGGWFYGSGDSNPNDNRHETFFQILPTPRIYARFPFYNLMNRKDGFVQVIDRPAKRLELRGDVHWLQLSSSQDLWYLGGGAFDNKVFGYVGRTSNGHASFASVADVSSDWQATKNLAVNLYYAYASGKSVVSSIYPVDHNAQYGYVEVVYHWGMPQRASK
ncbi:MAG: alginate export family protein, partial [Acidobacteriaceae bacterium]